MAISPVEIRHVRLTRSLLGFNRPFTKDLLEDIASSYEDVWRERADLEDKVEQLEADIVRYRELETLLRTTLISAERAAQELKQHARREAALVVSEAHAEARATTRAAMAEQERLQGESHRIRALLRAALETLGEADLEERAPVASAEAA
ncbi:MAG: DivIVA domain-containing protein [Actinobacteria bacterium]|nr:DivIVA domain-containing protein [Actinomycetota bacterium]